MLSAITLDAPDSTSASDVTRRLAAGDGRRPLWDVRDTVDQLIARRAQVNPDAVAAVDGGVDLSYRTFLERAAGLAQLLRERGIGHGMRVGVCSEPSVALFTSMLAVWSVGATYVPLDPSLPKARIAQIGLDAAVALTLVTAATAAKVDAADTLFVDHGIPETGVRFASDARLADVAIIIYTSGSTGVPKGVAIRHDGLTNAILAANELHAIDARDRQMCRTSIAFDVSFLEIVAPLVAGATLVVAPRATWADARAFVALMAANAITSINLTASFLAVLLDEPSLATCTSLRVVSCGGEALSIGLCRRFFAATRAALYNIYGPSEATIFVTSHRCRPADAVSHEETAPLGEPLPNTHVTIRDADLVPVAPGASGEIVIGGVQLANGYTNNPSEMAARFVADPLRPGQRLYRTGDLARLGYDGSIVFLGRNDKQVKIRGHRVEPSEVAAAIERLEGVRKAAVLARMRRVAGAEDALVLVAYVAGRTGASLDPAAIRHALRDQLPRAMVPSEIVLVDEFPHTLTGKIDEAALALNAPQRGDRDVRVVAGATASQHTVHDQVRAIWEDLLDIEGIGNDEDFYDLGGDSMLAVTLMMRLEKTFGRRASFAEFFDAMTIANLSELLSNDTEAVESEAIAFNESGSLPPLVFLHGDFAGGRYAWSLAALLGEDQPLLVLPPHGLVGRPPATDVESMAADVTAIVAKYHPTGPLRIAGFSAAGMLAYEAARQLQRAGREVLDVVVVGTGAKSVGFAGLDRFVRRLPLPRAWGEWFARGAIHAGFGWLRLAYFNPRAEWAEMCRAFRRTRELRGTTQAAIEEDAAFIQYVQAHKFAIPEPYDGRTLVVWPKEQIVEHGDIRNWSRVAPKLEVVYVSGTHSTAVSRYLHEIADAMRSRFAEPLV